MLNNLQKLVRAFVKRVDTLVEDGADNKDYCEELVDFNAEFKTVLEMRRRAQEALLEAQKDIVRASQRQH